MSLKLHSINIGKPISVTFQNKQLETAIFKNQVKHAIYVSELGLEGDVQANPIHHGGKDKAICVYPFEHYSYWENILGKKLAPAAFGENLTISGLIESEANIGDVLQIGDVIVQITQPRQPCFKLSILHHNEQLPDLSRDTGFTGYYLRVIKPGKISPESKVERIHRHEAHVSIDFTNQMMYHNTNNKPGFQQILAVDELAESLRKTLQSKLQL